MGRAGAELGLELGGVGGDGLVGNAEGGGDLGQGAPFGQAAQDFGFTPAQRVGASGAQERDFARHGGGEVAFAAQERSDRLQEALRRVGFGEEGAGADFDGAGGDGGVGVHAEGDEAGLGGARHDLADDLEAGGAGQVDIDEREIGAQVVEGGDARGAVAGVENLDVVEGGEDGAAAGDHDGVIVDYQQTQGFPLGKDSGLIARMSRLSLRLRLSLVLAGVLALLIALDIALTLTGAGRRIEPEVANATALSADVLRESVKSLTPTPGLDRRLADLAVSLDRLRHVRVSFAADGAPTPPPSPRARAEPPDWFVRLLAPTATSQRIAAPGGVFLVEGDPRDEIGELWDALVTLSLDGLASAALGFGVVYLALGAALRPLERLKAGLAALGEGRYGARLPEAGPREFEPLIARFNTLGGALNTAERENRALRARLVSIQDEERKEIARELHDEMGPYLFAARAQAGAARRAGGAEVDAVIETLDALQAVNRRLLDRLRPAALEELGLGPALEALARFFERSREGLAVSVDCDDPPDLEAGLETALYRIAQEALTNAARHSGAGRVSVTLRARDGLTLEIADDGRGMAAGTAPGRGLVGMRERAAAYGGALTVTPGPRGVVVRAAFPERAGQSGVVR